MPTGLVRRGARYSIRRRVPQELIAHYGKQEIVQALGTSEPKEARRRLPIRWAELDREFDAARANIRVPAAVTSQLVVKNVGAGMSREQWDHMLESARLIEDEAMRDAFERGETEEIETELMRLVAGSADNLTIEQRAFRNLLRDKEYHRKVALEGAAIASSELKQARRDTTKAKSADKGPETTSVRATSFDALVDRWAAERKVSAKGVADHRAVTRWFVDRVGKPTIETITKPDVLKFKDALLAENATAANINVKLTRLRTLLNYALANDWITANPADGVKLIDKQAAKRKRREFTPEALAQLFGGPVHLLGSRPDAGGGEAAYWLPLLALFTGARQTELGQLHPDDVRQERYVDKGGVEHMAWVMQFADNEERGQKVKTEGSERRVPLHSAVIDLGFLALVADAKAQGRERIFHEIKSGAKEELMGRWSKWFTRYRRSLGVTATNTPFHSFRHSFKHYARLCGMRKEVSDEITGHETGDVGDDYGGLSYPLAPLVEGISLYQVPGFKLPPRPS